MDRRTVEDHIRQVAEGKRGWVSLTQVSKLSGISKKELVQMAEQNGLVIERSHGSHGTTAVLPATKE